MTISFRLSRAGLVVFAVTQVAPVCRSAGTFRVRGRAGLNRLQFRGRVRGRALPPGTYRVSALARRGRIARITIVIAATTPTARELRAARLANVCGSRTQTLVSSRGTPQDLRAPDAAQSPAADGEAPESAPELSAAGPLGEGPRSGILGARFAQPFDAVNPLQPYLLAALLLAIGLLGVAALPRTATPGPRTAELLTTRRPEVALAGGLALAAGFALYVASFF